MTGGIKSGVRRRRRSADAHETCQSPHHIKGQQGQLLTPFPSIPRIVTILTDNRDDVVVAGELLRLAHRLSWIGRRGILSTGPSAAAAAISTAASAAISTASTPAATGGAPACQKARAHRNVLRKREKPCRPSGTIAGREAAGDVAVGVPLHRLGRGLPRRHRHHPGQHLREGRLVVDAPHRAQRADQCLLRARQGSADDGRPRLHIPAQMAPCGLRIAEASQRPADIRRGQSGPLWVVAVHVGGGSRQGQVDGSRPGLAWLRHHDGRPRARAVHAADHQPQGADGPRGGRHRIDGRCLCLRHRGLHERRNLDTEYVSCPPPR